MAWYGHRGQRPQPRHRRQRGHKRGWLLAGAAVLVLGTLAGFSAAAAHGPAAHGPAAVGPLGTSAAAAARPVIAGYYYHSAAMPVAAIPADRLTDVIYAFAGIDSAGHCAAPDASTAADFAALGALKRAHPQLRTELSIGGWGAGGFSDAALTAQSRAALVNSCMSMIFGTYRGDFDGIDIDWEFPVYGGAPGTARRPADRDDFTLLAQAFRGALNNAGRQLHEHLLLTAALPAGRLQSDGPYDPARSYQLAAAGRVLDWVNLMTYDLEDGESTVSDFDSPMSTAPADPTPQVIERWNTVAAAVEYYQRNGVPAGKIVLGEPYYSLGYTVASSAGSGLYQKITGLAQAPSWTQIETSLLHDPAWTSHRSADAQVPWLFNAATRTFVTYDDPASLTVKSQFARAHHLRGVFSWAINQDDSSRSLLTAMTAPFDRGAGHRARSGG